MYMFDAPCQVKDCCLYTRGEDAFCSVCRRYLCRSHYDRRRHRCRYQGGPNWFREKWQTLADLNVEALYQEVERLRPGEAFKVAENLQDLSDRDDMGINLHVSIVFEDGVEWLLRVPSFSDVPDPSAMVAQIRLSEVLTYRALHARGVAVPAVYGWGLGTLSKSKDPCFTHILYEKLPGSPLHDLGALSTEQVYNLVDSYAQQSIKISQVNFPAIGGLRVDDVGATVIGSSVDTRETNGPDSQDLGGPFKSSREKYIYRMEASLSAIRAGQLFRAAPLKAYLAHLRVKDLILQCAALKEDEHDFYLRHPDGKSDNILISTDGTVTALLDWQWAETTCKTAAFGAPRWMYNESFWEGNMELSTLELQLCDAYERHGRADLAECVRNARIHQLLDAFFSEDLYTYRGYLTQLLPTLNAMTTAMDPDSETEEQKPVHVWQMQIEKAYEGAEGLAEVRVLQKLAQSGVRKPSAIVYPLQKWTRRIWNGCHGLLPSGFKK